MAFFRAYLATILNNFVGIVCVILIEDLRGERFQFVNNKLRRNVYVFALKQHLLCMTKVHCFWNKLCMNLWNFTIKLLFYTAILHSTVVENRLWRGIITEIKQAKGQFISKGNFSVFNSPKNLTWTCFFLPWPTGAEIFHLFFGRIGKSKKPFGN